MAIPPADLKVITPADIVATVNYLVNLPYGIGTIDDIDHLGNRRLKTVGELCRTSSGSVCHAWSE